MIVGLGLLLTTIGGHDGDSRNSDPSVHDGWRDRFLAGSRVDTAPLGEEQIDVQLHTQAKLLSYSMQEQGSTSTAATGKPTGAAQENELLDGVWDTAIKVGSTPSSGRAGVEGLICAYSWPQGCDYWIAVFACESSLDPTKDTNWPYIGLGQIDVELHHDLILSMGYTIEDMHLAEPNLAVSWRLSHDGTRTSPWPWCQWQ